MSIDKPTSPSENQPQISWHALTSEQIIRQLATPPETGLTSEEASPAVGIVWTEPADRSPRCDLLADAARPIQQLSW